MTVPAEEVNPKHITLRLDERLVLELQRRAKRNDRSLSAEARQAIRAYLDTDEDEEAA